MQPHVSARSKSKSSLYDSVKVPSQERTLSAETKRRGPGQIAQYQDAIEAFVQRNAYYKACDEHNANRSSKVRKNRDETYLKISLEEQPRKQRPESTLPIFIEKQIKTTSTTKKLEQSKMKRNFDYTTRKRSPVDEKIFV